MGDTKLERFLPKNQRKLLNFEFSINGELSKSDKSLSIFFSLKNTNLGAHFLLLSFFDKINSFNHFITKIRPNF